MFRLALPVAVWRCRLTTPDSAARPQPAPTRRQRLGLGDLTCPEMRPSGSWHTAPWLDGAESALHRIYIELRGSPKLKRPKGFQSLRGASARRRLAALGTGATLAWKVILIFSASAHRIFHSNTIDDRVKLCDNVHRSPLELSRDSCAVTAGLRSTRHGAPLPQVRVHICAGRLFRRLAECCGTVSARWIYRGRARQLPRRFRDLSRVLKEII